MPLLLSLCLVCVVHSQPAGIWLERGILSSQLRSLCGAVSLEPSSLVHPYKSRERLGTAALTEAVAEEEEEKEASSASSLLARWCRCCSASVRRG